MCIRDRTSTVHKKRNQRRRSIPYERCVDAERPHACSSLRYALTGSKTVPLASTSRNGSNRSLLASRNPRWNTTNDDRSRGASAISVTERNRSQELLDLSAVTPRRPSETGQESSSETPQTCSLKLSTRNSGPQPGAAGRRSLVVPAGLPKAAQLGQPVGRP